MHGYRYTLRTPDGGWRTWEGKGYLARDIAEEAFNHVCEVWINGELPPPPKWWQFWKDDIERPDPILHVY